MFDKVLRAPAVTLLSALSRRVPRAIRRAGGARGYNFPKTHIGGGDYGPTFAAITTYGRFPSSA